MNLITKSTDRNIPLNMRLIFLLCIFSNISFCGLAQQQIDITPRPVKITPSNGYPFEFDQTTLLLYDSAFREQAVYFSEQLEQLTGIRIQTSSLQEKNIQSGIIALIFDSIQANKPEMYLLDVEHKRITLKARDVRGIINGIQSLLQLS